MRCRQTATLCCSLWVSAASSAFAGVGGLTGNEWIEHCKSGSAGKNGICFAYARGLADAFTLAGQYVEGVRSCIPKEATSEQLRDIGLNFLAKHPELRHLPAGQLLGVAFKQAWSC
jgi:hypothetical protein